MKIYRFYDPFYLKKIMRYEKQNIHFISDFHIGHKNVLKYDGRPFEDVDEMHVELIKRWNNVVEDDDIVYYLGDLAFCRDETTVWFLHSFKNTLPIFLKNNKEKISFIHIDCDTYQSTKDVFDNIKFDRFENIHESGTEIFIKDEDLKSARGSQGYQQFILSHYPILSWNRAHYGSIHLHGHCHGSLMKSNQDYYKRKVLDVGCNVIDYTPISYQGVKDIMEKKIISSVDHHGED